MEKIADWIHDRIIGTNKYREKIDMYDDTGDRVYDSRKGRRFFAGEDFMVSVDYDDEEDRFIMHFHYNIGVDMDEISNHAEGFKNMAALYGMQWNMVDYDEAITPKRFAVDAHRKRNDLKEYNKENTKMIRKNEWYKPGMKLGRIPLDEAFELYRNASDIFNRNQTGKLHSWVAYDPESCRLNVHMNVLEKSRNGGIAHEGREIFNRIINKMKKTESLMEKYDYRSVEEFNEDIHLPLENADLMDDNFECFCESKEASMQNDMIREFDDVEDYAETREQIAKREQQEADAVLAKMNELYFEKSYDSEARKKIAPRDFRNPSDMMAFDLDDLIQRIPTTDRSGRDLGFNLLSNWMRKIVTKIQEGGPKPTEAEDKIFKKFLAQAQKQGVFDASKYSSEGTGPGKGASLWIDRLMKAVNNPEFNLDHYRTGLSDEHMSDSKHASVTMRRLYDKIGRIDPELAKYLGTIAYKLRGKVELTDEEADVAMHALKLKHAVDDYRTAPAYESRMVREDAAEAAMMMNKANSVMFEAEKKVGLTADRLGFNSNENEMMQRILEAADRIRNDEQLKQYVRRLVHSLKEGNTIEQEESDVIELVYERSQDPDNIAKNDDSASLANPTDELKDWICSNPKLDRIFNEWSGEIPSSTDDESFITLNLDDFVDRETRRIEDERENAILDGEELEFGSSNPMDKPEEGEYQRFGESFDMHCRDVMREWSIDGGDDDLPRSINVNKFVDKKMRSIDDEAEREIGDLDLDDMKLRDPGLEDDENTERGSDFLPSAERDMIRSNSMHQSMRARGMNRNLRPSPFEGRHANGNQLKESYTKNDPNHIEINDSGMVVINERISRYRVRESADDRGYEIHDTDGNVWNGIEPTMDDVMHRLQLHYNKVEKVQENEEKPVVESKPKRINESKQNSSDKLLDQFSSMLDDERSENPYLKV